MRTTILKRAAAMAAMLMTTSALAQDLAPLNDLGACRLDGERVALSFSYEGGACQETGEAKTVTEDGVTTIAVPTANTAEVCTMQVVQVQYAAAVQVGADVSALTVQVLNPDGEVQAGGKTDIAAQSSECIEPAKAE